MKNKVVVIIISLLMLLTIGFSYAYFTGGNENDSTDLKIASKELSVIFTDTKEISNLDITPGWSDSKSFTVENKSNGTYNYNIVFSNLVNTFVTEGSLQYKITSSNGGYNMSEWVDIPKSSSPTDVVLVYDVDIEVGVKQEYTIEFRYYDNPDVDQSEDIGKEFNGSLMITEGSIDPNIKYSVRLSGNDFTVDSSVKETIMNGSVEFNVEANEGYTLSNPTIECSGGAVGSISESIVTISNVTTDQTCTVTLKKASYIVSVTSNNNNYGTVSPTSQSVEHGSNAIITLSPKTGYQYKSNTCGGTVSGNTMTISNVTSAKSCTVTFESYTPAGNTLYSVLTSGNYYTTIKTRAAGTFDAILGSSTATTKTIYRENTYRETSGNNNKNVYYFAGNVADNWVEFAGKMWRIIRTNEDGGVRLLYHGTSTTATDAYIGTSAYNGTYNNTRYVGYMYGSTGSIGNNRTNGTSSGVKTVVDNWYRDNINSSYGNYVSETAIYCNDRASGEYASSGFMSYAARNRLYHQENAGRQPTYQCGQNSAGGYVKTDNSTWVSSTAAYTSAAPSTADIFSKSTASGENGKLTYPVGLMTADEVAYAGGLYGTNSPNTYYYLNSAGGSSTGANFWWTMSPYEFNGSRAVVFVVGGSGYSGALSGHGVNSTRAVRPVLSLKSCVVVSSGNGTAESPYKVELPSTCSTAEN